MTSLRDTAAPPCYGVCCPKHGDCSRYLAVDGMRGGPVVGTCATDGTHPGFVPIRVEAVV